MPKKYLYAALETEVRAGYLNLDEILEGIPELLETNEGERNTELEAQLVRFVEAKMQNQLELEASWQGESINDRIDRAFEELSGIGIIAVQNAGYEWDSGWDEVKSFAEEEQMQGRLPLGGVFFHGQDVTRGVNGKGLFLMFGAFEEDSEKKAAADLRIGGQIVEVLNKHKIAVKWDGDVSSRIEILPFEWRKSRSSREGFFGSGK